jgi:hypothetical protein
MPATIANRALVEEGRVVWGDASVLEGARRVDPREIPREDALNLVLNRAAEEMLARAAARRAPADEDAAVAVFLRGIKTVADMGLALLMARGEQTTPYAGRGARVAAALAGDAALRSAMPAGFAEAVGDACAWKLAPGADALRGHVPGSGGDPEAARRWRAERIAAVRGFLAWYAGEPGDPLAALARSEPIARAARAWVRAARRSPEAARGTVARALAGRVRPSPRLGAQLAAAALFLRSAEDAGSGAPRAAVERTAAGRTAADAADAERAEEDAVLAAWGREVMGWGEA